MYISSGGSDGFYGFIFKQRLSSLKEIQGVVFVSWWLFPSAVDLAALTMSQSQLGKAI